MLPTTRLLSSSYKKGKTVLDSLVIQWLELFKYISVVNAGIPAAALKSGFLKRNPGKILRPVFIHYLVMSNLLNSCCFSVFLVGRNYDRLLLITKLRP